MFIGATDEILIETEAFADCTGLCFAASNAMYGDVRDWDFSAATANGNRTLYCPTNAEEYTGNWVSFTEASNVIYYAMVDCGGTKVLYGCADNRPWLVLRSGTDVTDQINLDPETIEIFSDAMQDAKATSDTGFTVNWEQLTKLSYIDSSAFEKSDLGVNVVLPKSMSVDTAAFKGCTKLATLDMPGYNIHLGSNVFEDCENLTSVSFDHFAFGMSLWYGIS